MPYKLVTSVEQFPRFSPRATVIVDVETTNFDDTTDGLNPFTGSRACGYAIGDEDGENQWYLPVRHHGSLDCDNLNVAAVQAYLKDLLGLETRTYSNHNMKFDGRVMHFDGIKIKAKMQDTMTLARLIECDRYSYRLASLVPDYVDHATSKGDVVPYLKALGTMDFGRVPLSIMTEYACNDARITALLRKALLKQLPPMSQRVWQIEQDITPVLLESEIAGMRVNLPLIRSTLRDVLLREIRLHEEIERIAGHEVTISNAGLTKLLMDELGIQPTQFGKCKVKGCKFCGTTACRDLDHVNPSWRGMTLMMIKHPVGPLLAEASQLQHFRSTYLEGWLKRIGQDGRLHADIRQHGTMTGRMSCGDPNLQDLCPEAEAFVLPDDGNVFVYNDYSQMEYRFFGHYTNDPFIINTYLNNPAADFHQAIADLVGGVERQFAKSMNFSFVYGMGRKAMVSALAATLALKSLESTETKNLMTKTGRHARDAAADLDVTPWIPEANRFYDLYHQKVPSIRKFQTLVKSALSDRGYIRNYFGRVYRNMSAHCAVNYLIQGGCADLFKWRIHEAWKALRVAPIIVVHDSALFQCPREAVYEFANTSREVMQDASELKMKIPMLVQCAVGASSWGQVVGIDQRGHMSRAEIDAALLESETVAVRKWGTHN